MVEMDGKNLVFENGRISNTSKKMIAGILDAADAITAFGNTIPTSYLRLVPHQEAPQIYAGVSVTVRWLSVFHLAGLAPNRWLPMQILPIQAHSQQD